MSTWGEGIVRLFVGHVFIGYKTCFTMTLGGVNEFEKWARSGPYERFYVYQVLCKRIFLRNKYFGR